MAFEFFVPNSNLMFEHHWQRKNISTVCSNF
jgi:hypothetical protein